MGRPAMEVGPAECLVPDRGHGATCESGHGCREHSQAKIRAEPVEDGIPDFANGAQGRP